jgi:hypothetical protein
MLKSFFDKITRASLRFKWGTIIITILVFIAGLVAMTQFNRELIPPIEFPQTVVISFNPGEDGEVMLNAVTIPVEEAVSDIEGVVNVESTTTSGVSAVIVMSEFGLDQTAIREEIQVSIDALEFPEGMDPPQILSFSLSDLPIVSSSVSGSGFNLIELKELVEDEIIPELEAIDGVALVEVSGGQIIPSEPPPTPEPTEEPTPTPTDTPEPTPEPTSTPTETPTEVPTETPTETPTEEALVLVALPLPDSWIQSASSMGFTLETTDDLIPEVIAGIAQFAPHMLAELTPDMLLVIPIDALLALPADYISGLDQELQAQLVERMAEVEGPVLVALPLPDSWIQGAASMGFTLETTDDLTPEIITAIANFAPQMLDELTPEMLLVMPIDALLALPVGYRNNR